VTRLTRTYRFSASHRLHSDQLSTDENRDLYGKCNNPYGHGHDYVLRVTVHGDIDPTTGRVVQPGKLDRYVHERVIDMFDHKDMNTDVPDFAGVPTTENLVRDIERRLRANWGEQFAPAELDAVWIQETPKNKFELRSR
jgi:6-pyruvoyltetrahydropterin/6-carboxytetrahydropterin synthase